MKGGLDSLETRKKTKIKIFEQSHNAEKSEKRDRVRFFSIRSVAKYQKKEGRPFGDNEKFSKKTDKAEGGSLSKKVEPTASDS